MSNSSPLTQFLHWEKNTPDRIYLRQPLEGKWKTWTWAEAGNDARCLVKGLRELGLKKGDHVALLSKNCAQWIIADIALMMGGFVSVPIYPTLSSHSMRPILIHSDAKAIIIGKLDDYKEQQKGIPENMIRIGIKTFGIREEFSWEDMLNNQPLAMLTPLDDEEIITIIYTSGTTGITKGAMHTASNFDITAQAGIPHLELPKQADLFSYLPLSHIAERVGSEMYSLYSGCNISFAESIEKFPMNLAQAQPHVFFGVPRIWTKIREGILAKMSQSVLGFLLSIPGINKLLIKSIKKKLGFSRTSHFFSGAAPISVELQEWYKKIGINIFQVYGMTEDCCYSHFCCPKAHKFGTVGKPFPGLLVKISADGEIMEKSGGNMKGYYKEPMLTKESFDEEGYYKTGDKGEYDKDGFLKITGRVKDIFKTDKGKYISPAPIEVKILSNTDIEYVCVVGTGVPQPIGLVSLSESGLKKSKENISRSLELTLKEINPLFEKFEQLAKLVIMKENWTTANGKITPSLKVRRNEIEKIHLLSYPHWYKKDGMVIWE